MLVLTRKKHESIIIADNIEISVVDVTKGHVKLGIKAPLKVTVHRKEIYEAIRKENVKAAKVKLDDVSKVKDILKIKSEKK